MNAGPRTLHLLGAPAVTVEGVRHDVVPTRPALLLLYLGAVGRWVSREEHLGTNHQKAQEARRVITEVLDSHRSGE